MYKSYFFIHASNGDNMKENEYFNQRIGCNVKECKYHSPEDHCTLGKIVVSGEREKQATFCDSFQKVEE